MFLNKLWEILLPRWDTEEDQTSTTKQGKCQLVMEHNVSFLINANKEKLQGKTKESFLKIVFYNF